MHKNKFKVGDVVTPKRDGLGLVAGHRYTVESEATPTWGGALRWVMLDGVRNPVTSDGSFREDDLVGAPLTITAGRYYKTRSGAVVGPMVTDDIGFRTNIDGNVRVFDKAGGHVFGNANLDLVDEVTFRIEAGKYYRTRDGRKVGPMTVWPGNDVFATSGGFRGGLWNSDGSPRYKGMDDSPDLIAEWTDEPAKPKGNAAAQVDNLQEEYGATTRKMKFKVGDRVVGTQNPIKYVVMRIRENGNLDVKADSGLEYRNCKPSLFKSPGAPAIVAVIENGQPKPATRPFVHPDRETAQREATRLAKKHPGKEFAVYEQVAVAKEAKVYDHEWQRLAASGAKIEAIKALRERADLTLKGAKDAIEHWLVVAA